MNGYTKFPEKKMYIILITVAMIIAFSSIEVLMRVKDGNLFEAWQQAVISSGDYDTGFTPGMDEYVGVEMFKYIFKIIIPMGFGLLTFLTYKKLRLNRLFVFIWSVLLLGGLAYTFFELNFASIFYYLIIAGYLVLIVTVLSLSNEMSNTKKI